MNSKYKYIFTLLLSILVVFGGGFIFNDQLGKTKREGYLKDDYITGVYVDHATQLNKGSYKPRQLKSVDKENSILPEKKSQYTTSSYISSSSLSFYMLQPPSVNQTRMKKAKDESLTDGSALVEVLAYGGRKGYIIGKTDANVAGGGVQNRVLMPSSMNVLLLSNNDDIILIDPSGDPDPVHRIPVGDGIIFICLMGILYMLIRKIRN